MTSKRVPLALALSAVLFVTSGFAATKKTQRHDRSGDWNDLSLQSGDLLSTGSSVPSDGGSASLSMGTLESSSLALSPGTPDNWNGGTGNWSSAGNWSAGSPGASSDVTIYSGGNDTVTLDTSPTISSLVLGGASNDTTSELIDGGAAQTLTITDGLAVGPTGYLHLTGGSTVTAGADSSNAGTIFLYNGSTLAITGNLDNTGVLSTGIFFGAGGDTVTINGMLTNETGGQFALYGPGDVGNIGTLKNSGAVFIGPGATLNLLNQAGGITDVVAASRFDVLGSFNDVLGGTSAFANLTGVEGWVALSNGQTNNITPGGGLLTIANTGHFDVSAGSTVNIDGDVNNSGLLATNDNIYGGGNTLTINGNLTNALNGTVTVYGPGDLLHVNGNLDNSGQLTLFDGDAGELTLNGMLTNETSGQIHLNGTDVLQVNGDLENFGQVAVNQFSGGGSTVNVTGTLTNEAGGTLVLNGPGDMATLGSLDNSGTVDVENHSTLTINGDATNSGIIQTGSTRGGNTLNITGQLTNNGTFGMVGAAFEDMATIGSVVNNGLISPYNSSVLTVNGDVDNFGTVGLSSHGGTVNIAGTLTNEVFNGLYSGLIRLYGLNLTAGNVVNYGLIDFEEQGTLTVNGNVDNSGMIVNGYYLHRYGFTLNIAGTLTNDGLVELDQTSFGTAAIGSLVNSGSFDLGGQNTAMIGSVNNGGTLSLYNDSMATLGSLSNAGTVNVNNGSTLQITGDATNSGTLQTGLNGGGNTLNVNGTLTNLAGGTFSLNGSGDIANVGNLNNSGYVYVGSGATLDVGNAGGITFVLQGRFDILGNFNCFPSSSCSEFGGSAFQNLTRITGGTVVLANGQNTQIFPEFGPLLMESATLDASRGSTIQIVTNVEMVGGFFGGLLATGDPSYYGGGNNTINVEGDLFIANGDLFLYGNGDKVSVGGNLDNEGGQIALYNSNQTLTVAGLLTNNGSFTLNGSNDTAAVGSVANGGTMDIEQASAFAVAGDVNNSGKIFTSGNGGSGGNMITISGELYNNPGASFVLYGPGDTATIGSVVNSGFIDLENNSTLTVKGDVNNSGSIYTSFYGGSGGNTLEIDGTLTNSPGAQFALFNPTDRLINKGWGHWTLQRRCTQHSNVEQRRNHQRGYPLDFAGRLGSITRAQL